MSTTETAPVLVTVREMAALMGVSPKTIYRQIERGKFPLEPVRYSVDGRCNLRFNRAKVEELLQEG